MCRNLNVILEASGGIDLTDGVRLKFYRMIHFEETIESDNDLNLNG